MSNKPEYLRRILLAEERNGWKIDVHGLLVYHDATCTQVARGGICDCDPIIEATVQGRECEIDKHGGVKWVFSSEGGEMKHWQQQKAKHRRSAERNRRELELMRKLHGQPEKPKPERANDGK